MDKRELTLAELDGELAFELPRRDTLAVAVGGLAAVAIDRINVNVPINVDVSDNTVCVNAAAVLSAARQNC
jgi:hypothetical protein